MELVQDNHGIWVDSAVNYDLISYPSTGNADTYEIEDQSFWFKNRNSILLEIIPNFFKSGDFVDVGGGNGYQALSIQKTLGNKSKVVLVEPGFEGCLNASTRGLKEIYNCTFENFPIGKFNVKGIGLFDVIEHIEDDVQFLKDIIAKLNKGTFIFITVPAYQNLYAEIDDYSGHYRRYNKKMVGLLADHVNAKLVFFSYFFSYLVPFMLLLRRLPYLLKNEKAVSQKEVLLANEKANITGGGSFFSNIFSFLNRFEKRRISRLRSVFTGTSCLVVLQVN